MNHGLCMFGLYGLYANPEGFQERFSLPLQKSSCDVTVRGFVAHVKATLVYENNQDFAAQAHYSCPVDESSAVYHLEAVLNDTKILAQCLEKKKAKKVYKEAVESGRTAVLMGEDQDSSDVVHLSLGNLREKTSAEITMFMVIDLKVSTDGGVQFTLPTVLNPRYCPNKSRTDDFFQKASSLGQKIVMNSSPYTIDVKAAVSGSLKIAKVVSHSDQIDVQMEDDELGAKISQITEFSTDHDWTFVIYYRNPYTPQVLVESGDETATGLMKDQVMMLNFFPEIPANSYSNRNEVIFVVDRSGSMNGQRIQSAKAVLLLFLKSLPPGCYFNIVSFGSSFDVLFQKGSAEYNEKNLQKAIRLQESMSADMGGTEILKPLQFIYRNPPKDNYSRQILLLTDGAVWNVDVVTALASRNAGNTRVFTVGIGDGASTALVNGLARAGKGRAEMVTQRDRIQSKVMGLVSSMLQSSIQNVSVTTEFDTASRFSLVPSAPPVIFAGQHFTAYARTPSEAVLKKIRISGSIDGAEWSTEVTTENIKKIHDENLTFHRLAARAKILDSLDDDTDESREELVDLSVKSGVLCRYTSFVAVDQDGGTIARKPPSTRSEMESLYDAVSMPMNRRARGFSMMTNIGPQGIGSLQSGGSIYFDAKAAPEMASNLFGSSAASAFPPPTMACNAFGSSPSVRKGKGVPVKKMMMKKKSKKIPAYNPSFDCVDSSQMCDMEVEEESGDDKESILSDLIAGQNFDGTWQFVNLSQILKIDSSEFEKMKSSDRLNSLSATCIALAALEMFFAHRSDEWMLMAGKAKTFLSKSFDSEGEKKIDEALQLARNFLKDLVQKYEHLRALTPN